LRGVRFLRSGEEPCIFAWGNGSSMASAESVARPDGTIPANRGPKDMWLIGGMQKAGALESGAKRGWPKVYSRVCVRV
jgi:hypothetical protein